MIHFVNTYHEFWWDLVRYRDISECNTVGNFILYLHSEWRDSVLLTSLSTLCIEVSYSGSPVNTAISRFYISVLCEYELLSATRKLPLSVTSMQGEKVEQCNMPSTVLRDKGNVQQYIQSITAKRPVPVWTEPKKHANVEHLVQFRGKQCILMTACYFEYKIPSATRGVCFI